jgi:hypothetical protein
MGRGGTEQELPIGAPRTLGPTALRAKTEEMNEAIYDAFGETRGACGLAAHLLAIELQREGMDVWLAHGQYDCPTRGYKAGHTWIESSFLIIDPTRDQFEEGRKVFTKQSKDAKRYSASSRSEITERKAAEEIDRHLKTPWSAEGTQILAEKFSFAFAA